MNTENNTENRENPGSVKVTPKPAAGSPERFMKLGLYALIFALVYAFGTYRNPGGIALTVPAAGMFFMLSKARSVLNTSAADVKSKAVRRFLLFLTASCILLSVNAWTSASSVLQIFDKAGITILAAVYIITDSLGEADKDSWAPDVWLARILKACTAPLARFFIPFTDMTAFIRSKRNKKVSSEKVSAVLKGVIIAVPLLLVTLLLLDDADLVFDRLIVKIADSLTMPEIIARNLLLVLVIILSFIGFYTIVSGYYEKDPETGAADSRSITKSDPLTAITFLIPLSGVYIIFCLIQLVYLPGRMALPEGITYAEYAHQGFYQLVIVSMINLVLVTACRSRFAKHRILSVLMIVMSCCTYIMIASSAARMILYIREYCLTFLRVFVLWFLLVLSVWLAVIIISIIREKTPLFRICLIAVTVLYLLFAFTHPDYFIARYNLSHSGYTDTYYITESLSADAVPAYAHDPALLSDRKAWLESYEDSENDIWFITRIRQFNVSEAVAARYLRSQGNTE